MGVLWRNQYKKDILLFHEESESKDLCHYAMGMQNIHFRWFGLSLIACTIFNSEYIGTVLMFFICWNAGSALIAWFAPLWSNEHSIFMKEHD